MNNTTPNGWGDAGDGWIPLAARTPDVDVVVETKIDDPPGNVRNVQPLKLTRGAGRLWFFPDASMYVYYTPTHWRPLAPPGDAHATQ